MDLFFTGTDIIYLNHYPDVRFLTRIKIFVFRVLVRVLDRWFTERNLVISENLKDELHLTKPITVCLLPFKPIIYPKQKHAGFYILYYLPKSKNKTFVKWLYGYDIIQQLKKRFDIEWAQWIEVDGSQNMNLIYPWIDIYLRPCNHDGDPYMIKECEANNIPYYWSKEKPSVEDAYKKIKEVFNNRDNQFLNWWKDFAQQL